MSENENKAHEDGQVENINNQPDAGTSQIVETMINNGVTKDELREVLEGFFKKEEPHVDVEAASKEYFTSLLHGVK